MANENIISLVEEYVKYLFREKSPSENIYHDINHTISVVKTAHQIGTASELSDKDMEIVLIAAWFNDLGSIDTLEEYESKSANYARNFLAEHDYEREKIQKIESCILATSVPQNPKNILEEVLCDADLHHLGDKTFFDRNELYRVELEKRIKKTYSDEEWLESTIEFFTDHKFFTKYAKEKFDEQKNSNLLKLQKKYRKQIKINEASKLKDAKLNLEKEKLKAKKELDKKSARGVETMFRNVMRTHVAFSEMADKKANIMISVNTLMLGGVATILARKLDTNPHLIIPTLILSLVCLTTLIFAIMVTRPKITAGTFTKEDIKSKKANLLFFGNFYNMKLDDFSWGMKEMMNDRVYLYDNMIRDFYFLGQVLGRKYKNLRICYTIFMYGFIIAIVAYAIAVIVTGQTAIGPLVD